MEGILLTRRKFKCPVIIMMTEPQTWHLGGVSVPSCHQHQDRFLGTCRLTPILMHSH